MSSTSFKEKIAHKLNEWRAETEHLKLQLHLGLKEAEKEFEKQKISIKKWAETAKEQAEDFGKDNYQNVRIKLEELIQKASAEKAETIDILKEQQENINQAITNLKNEFSGIYEDSKEEINEFWEQTESKLEQFHTRFDLLKLKLHLGKKEALDEWEEQKKNLNHKLHELSEKMDDLKDSSEEKLQHFSTEIKEAWKHLKNSFKN